MKTSQPQNLPAYPRTRHSSNIKTTSVQGQTVWLTCSGPSTFGAYTPIDKPYAMINGISDTMYDYVVPGFHNRRGRGEVFFNPMHHERVQIESLGSGVWSQRQKVPSVCSGVPRNNEFRLTGPNILSYIPTSSHPSFGMWPLEPRAMSENDVSRLQILASTSVHSKRGRSDSDLWESAAEFQKTLDLLRNPLNELVTKSNSLYLSLFNGSSGRRILKDTSSGYLLWRYGISPLLKDIQSILDTFKRTSGKQRKTTRQREQHNVVSVDTGSIIDGAARFTWVRKTTETVTVKAMSLDEVDLSFIGQVGFSFKGLLALPWELMSYSFVLDWAANLGDYFGSSLMSYGYNQLGSSLVTQRQLATAYTLTGVDSGIETDNWIYSGSLTGSIGIMRTSTTRGGLTSPGVALRTDFKTDSLYRAADAFSLIASRFTKINNLYKATDPKPVSYGQRKNMALWLNQPGVH